MGVDHASFDELCNRVDAFTGDWVPDLEAAGDAGRDRMVERVLDGESSVGGPFKPYSERYQKLIDRFGGKPGGVVNLRGIFPADGTRVRRPDRGVVDPESEMSAHLIRVESDGRTLTLTYESSGRQYMFAHQETRPWFGIDDDATQQAIMDRLAEMVEQRVRNFNR